MASINPTNPPAALNGRKPPLVDLEPSVPGQDDLLNRGVSSDAYGGEEFPPPLSSPPPMENLKHSVPCAWDKPPIPATRKPNRINLRFIPPSSRVQSENDFTKSGSNAACGAEKPWTTVRVKKKKSCGFRDHLWIPTRPAASLPKPGRSVFAVGHVSTRHGMASAPPETEKVPLSAPCQNKHSNSNSNPCPEPGASPSNPFGSLSLDNDHSDEILDLVESPNLENVAPLGPISSAGHTPFSRMARLSRVNRKGSIGGLDLAVRKGVYDFSCEIVAGFNLASPSSYTSILKSGSFIRGKAGSRWTSTGSHKLIPSHCC
ncbi:hypothetical protein NE237_000376 [Protea cynaroides]|uniref:Uncharacterized protein n=1 Tax=Protea cynaroides TaxID=273540 RepID=A0A9Q0QXF0_9MAGN|nr:hypothetical protein NE237_000376 [Protea cynaroides]